MSIFDFVKDAGKKIGLFDEEKAPEAKTSDSIQNATENIKKYLNQLNLGLESPSVKIEGDKAIIEGQAPSQEAMEKAVLALGNIEGISKVESRITTAQGGAVQPRFYTVKSGDTLSKIAKEMLGDANRYNEIFEANRPLLSNPNEIYPGQNLRIPQYQTA